MVMMNLYISLRFDGNLLVPCSSTLEKILIRLQSVFMNFI
jgi:hypothetical protein